MLPDINDISTLNLLQYYVFLRLKDDSQVSLKTISFEVLTRSNRAGQERYYSEWINGTRQLPRDMIDTLRSMILEHLYADDFAQGISKILQLNCN